MREQLSRNRWTKTNIRTIDRAVEEYSYLKTLLLRQHGKYGEKACWSTVKKYPERTLKPNDCPEET